MTTRLQRVGGSIVTRILLLGGMIVFLGIAVRYFVMSDFLRKDIGELAASQQLAMANYVAHDIDRKIVERRQLLERMARALPQQLLADPQALHAWLQQRQELFPLFSFGMMVIDPDGNTIADAPRRPERNGISYAERDYFRAARAGNAYIGKPVIGLAARRPVLPMAVPVVDAAGKTSAVLAGVTELAAPGFLDLLQKSRIGAGGDFLLVSSRDGLFVAAADPSMVLKPTPPKGTDPLHDRVMSGFRGTGITVNEKGVETVAAIASVPSAGWFVVARLPVGEAFAPLDRMQRFIIHYSWTMLIGFLVLAWIGLFFTFRPLFRTARYADRMTRGEVPLAALPIPRNDEVGYLTEAFNRLLAKLSESQAKLDSMAHHDQLTGLPNRLLLADRLQQALERARRHGTWLAVLSLDLDGFKPINDTLGHGAGDEALRQVAQRSSHTVRGNDTVARIGGDEFIIVIADIAAGEADNAMRTVAQSCLDAMAQPFNLDGAIRTLGVSIGAVAGDGDATPHDLMLVADEAMYEAKHGGRGRYVIAGELKRRVLGDAAAGESACVEATLSVR